MKIYKLRHVNAYIFFSFKDIHYFWCQTEDQKYSYKNPPLFIPNINTNASKNFHIVYSISN